MAKKVLGFKELVLKEWKAHKNNYDKDGEWFECSDVETDATCNYVVGAEINTIYANGREKKIILKTEKQANDYSKKMKKRYMGCAVCNRFKRLFSAAKKAGGGGFG